MSTAVCTKDMIAVDQMNFISGIKHNCPIDNLYIVECMDPKTNELENSYVIVCLGSKRQANFFVDNFLSLDTQHVLSTFHNMYKEPDLVSFVFNRNENTLEIYAAVSLLTPSNRNLSAIGSGFKYATGALEAGADAISALKITSKYDLMTDGKYIQYVDLNEYPYKVKTIGNN